MAARPATINTSVATSDTNVKAGPGKVYWVSHFAGATGGAWQLNDSTDDSGTDMYSANTAENSSTEHLHFDPPLTFEQGIYLDIPGTNVTVTVGYN